jgi:hypothetical protein
MKRGAYDYLTKPFHLPELEVQIRKAYEKAQLKRRERQWVEAAQINYESERRFTCVDSNNSRAARPPDCALPAHPVCDFGTVRLRAAIGPRPQTRAEG